MRAHRDEAQGDAEFYFHQFVYDLPRPHPKTNPYCGVLAVDPTKDLAALARGRTCEGVLLLIDLA